ncbi:aminoglycoside acetyltransferase [Penicillium riverlandense]|uniref:aminoglycoside acetyltransferase n=1 Tax=Penicillium riverlandense TaxID=1903569 RepID=UPI00254790F7|nr:aminoglycoside acetyltransferase [Penicillium riverlandense]KAJ5815600.1 aminoglycoside acetyltransferase [Penicillium riverlandense]
MKSLLVKEPLCTRQSLVNDLRNLGIKEGEIILLHSSLSSLGWVSGGAVTVIHALLDTLSDTGTLIVPSHSGDNSDPGKWQKPAVPEEWHATIRDTMPGYDARTTRTWRMGAIAETVRTWPGAVRSAHPQTSFAAVGCKAAELVADHAVDCLLGNESPLARLEAANARILLLGVGFELCTAFHLAEYRVSTTQENVSFAVCTPNGREWMTVQDTALSEDGFDRLGLDFERDRPVTRGIVGGAFARLFSLPSAVDYAQSWLPKHRSGMT